MHSLIKSTITKALKLALLIIAAAVLSAVAWGDNAKARTPVELASRRLSIPAGIGNVIAPSAGSRGAGVDDLFTVVTPQSTFVLDARPVFKWTACQGATSYVVTIQDTVSSAVIRSPHTADMHWTPAQDLTVGRVYQWQIVAYKGDDAIDARPLPPAPYAHFEILTASVAAATRQAVAKAGAGTVEAGLAYARSGDLDDAVVAFQAALKHPSQAARAKQALADIATIKAGDSD